MSNDFQASSLNARPLHGVRVLDLSRVLAGPYAAMMLADLGAEVIKVENPAHGDDSRTYTAPERDGHAVYFLTVNRGKKSVALDLKSPGGRDAFLALVAQSDVVVENFRTGVMERLGLGYEDLRAVRPSLVMCSISGYGRDGPNVNVPGYDPVIQAESGLMSMTGEPDGDPMRIGISLVDMVSGLYASNAIAAALRATERTGLGRFIEVPLLETGLNMLVNFAGGYLITGDEPRRVGNSNQIAQPVGLFEAQDGPVVIAAGNDIQFARLCKDVIQRSDLVDDPRFADNARRVANKEALKGEIEAALSAAPRSDWVRRLRDAGVPAGPVQGIAEALDSEPVRQRGAVQSVSHSALGSYPAVMTPQRFAETEDVDLSGAPLLGEHTRQVLAEIAGISYAEIDVLVASGAARVCE